MDQGGVNLVKYPPIGVRFQKHRPYKQMIDFAVYIAFPVFRRPFFRQPPQQHVQIRLWLVFLVR